MIARFMRLEEIYASKEISMDDLKVIQASKLVSFDNQGVSRSNKDCLLCKIRFDKLHDLIHKLTHTKFSSIHAVDRCIKESRLMLIKEYDSDCLSYADEDKHIEIIATIGKDGSVLVDKDDIEAIHTFSVFLRIQH